MRLRTPYAPTPDTKRARRSCGRSDGTAAPTRVRRTRGIACIHKLDYDTPNAVRLRPTSHHPSATEFSMKEKTLRLFGIREVAARLAALLLCVGTFAHCGGSDDFDPACVNDQCITPPSSDCEGDILITFAAVGSCDGDTCAYNRFATSCEDGCAEARCIGDATCENDPCNTPPAPTCDETARISYAALGSCSPHSGRCVYTEVRDPCPEGDVCVDGTCATPDPCDGIVCDDPPENTCSETGERVTHEDGVCAEGECTYAPSSTPCPAEEICDAGACIPDPCTGVICDDPPEDTCSETGERVTHEDEGVCDDGACTYVPVPTPCSADEICAAGACIPDPCDGIVCDDPPEDTCDENGARVFHEDGVCEDGACTYAPALVICPTGEVCTDGVCAAPDPCADIVCDDPPEDFCDDDGLQVTHDDGVCAAGTCTYAPVAQTCPADDVCENGTCVTPDPCADIVCDDPPEDFCDDDGLRVAHEPGVCDDGTCSYEPTTETCAIDDRCSLGACVDIAACETLCNERPEDFCDEENAVQFVDELPECDLTDETCAFAFATRDCSAQDATCEDGRCVFPEIAPGDILITELFVGVADGEPHEGGWFEVVNTTEDRRDLGDLTISIDADSFEIPVDTLLDPGAYLVFGVAGLAFDGDIRVVHIEDGFALSAEPEIALERDETTIDRISVDSAADWPLSTQQSTSRSDLTGPSDDAGNWCLTPEEPDFLYAPEHFGTPGEANPVCLPAD